MVNNSSYHNDYRTNTDHHKYGICISWLKIFETHENLSYKIVFIKVISIYLRQPNTLAMYVRYSVKMSIQEE